MPVFGSPFSGLASKKKLTDEELIRAIRFMVAAVDLLESPDFSTVDVIIPVPLHPGKYKKRGYNQSEWIGKGLSEILGKPQDTTTLKRIKENTTQTKKSVFERFENTEGIFECSNTETLTGMHVLLVDDVLTTGSTLEACINALLKTEGIKVSVFTIAVA